MRLHQLLSDVDVLEMRGDPAAADVASITHDTASVGPGTLFCCIRGTKVDGHDLAQEAVDRGAAALLCERFVNAEVPQARVGDARAAMAPAAAALHGHPSRAMRVAAVTGTNGKTTATYLLHAILEAAGWRTGVVGTLTGVRTTPEAPVLQEGLARFRDEGCKAVVMEVSSHALVQHRVDAVDFAVAVFTNLSQDHLDYHRTMEEYFAAKASLFEEGRAAAAVINADDPYGRRLIARAAGPVVPFSLDDAEDLQVGPAGSWFRWRASPVHLHLRGRFNVSNALAAATAAGVLGIEPSTAAEGLASVQTVPGRFELVDMGQPFSVIVDYAHTPDGMRQVLEAARELAGEGSRVIIVFGAGGDRDPAKRPLMGQAAAELADVVVLTSDNPRSEDPMAIIDEVRAGAAGAAELVVEPDRASAIVRALTWASPGDVVVVAGKGHETGQEIGGRVEPFDDRAVARSALAERASDRTTPGGVGIRRGGGTPGGDDTP